MRLGEWVVGEEMVWTDTAANEPNSGGQDGEQFLALSILISSHSSTRATHLASKEYTLDPC